jgi:predicted DNA-binding helix-hairpin-helix protein
MKYSNIAIVALDSMGKCDLAIESIENDHRNTQGGSTAYFSGYTTKLLVGAQAKVDAIERKSDRLFKQMIKKSYIVYAKAQGHTAVTFEVYDENEMYC